MITGFRGVLRPAFIFSMVIELGRAPGLMTSRRSTYRVISMSTATRIAAGICAVEYRTRPARQWYRPSGQANRLSEIPIPSVALPHRVRFRHIWFAQYVPEVVLQSGTIQILQRCPRNRFKFDARILAIGDHVNNFLLLHQFIFSRTAGFLVKVRWQSLKRSPVNSGPPAKSTVPSQPRVNRETIEDRITNATAHVAQMSGKSGHS